jgi:cell division initiation protein
MLTPVDLETTVFRRGFRGYRTKEVQEFMERLTVDFERLYKENIEMKEEKEKLLAQLAQYQQIEETLRNTMVIAQQTADEVKTASQKQGELILREAQHRADQIRARVREEIQGELQQLAELKQQTELFRYQFKKFIEGMSAMLDRQADSQELWEKIQQHITMNTPAASPSSAAQPSTQANPESTEPSGTSGTRTNPALIKAVFDSKGDDDGEPESSPFTAPQT